MRGRLLFAGFFALLCLPLFLLPSRFSTVESLAVADLLKRDGGLYGSLVEAREQGREAALDPDGTVGRLRLRWPLPEGPDVLRQKEERFDALRSSLRLPADAVAYSEPFFEARLPDLGGADVLQLTVETDPSTDLTLLRDSAGAIVPGGHDGSGARHLGSRISILPPLVAILLAFLTRATIPALFVGVAVGALLLAREGLLLLEAARILFVDIIGGVILSDWFRLYILGFVLLLSATVAVITRTGGVEGMVRSLVRFARSSRSVQAVAYFLGLGIFFDDYANTIVVGNSAAPLFDRMRVSRAKLAYIVDSTAAPVAGVALLSTWVAYQISTYAPQLPTIGVDADEGYSIFLQTIPYRFYCLFALALVALTIWLRREVGPMVAAERHAAEGRRSGAAGAAPLKTKFVMAPQAVPRWFNGVLPLMVMILGTAGLIFYSGQQAAGPRPEGMPVFTWLRLILSAADSTWAIFYGSLGALVAALVLGIAGRHVRAGDAMATAARGVSLLFRDALLILILAWTIGEVCTRLGTANYLVSVFQDLMQPAWLPTLLFLTACFVSFSTGSSWTTMAILQPNVVLLADRLGSGTDLGSHGLLVLSIGAVLEGSIFGDHCSPISDTTILSSAASGCRHMEHVRTQAPYALLAAGAAMAAGYLPTALFGAMPALSLGAGCAGLIVFLLLAGRNPRHGLNQTYSR